MKTRAHVVVSGQVQGVWYRATTKQNAEQLGVYGFVRNRIDGTVEAVFEGDEEAIDKIVEWCWTGPPNARVTNVDVVEKEYEEEFSNFEIY